MKVGNGLNTSFWSDCWVWEAPFRKWFRRLFDLFVIKDMIVAKMYSLGWKEGGEAWG
jgi:hypothetical protein